MPSRESADLLDEPLRLVQVGGRLVHAHRLAVTEVGPEILAQAVAIVANEGVGRRENIAVRAIVLLELDQVGDLVLALEGRHVADVGAAKSVDALVVVTDREHGGSAAGEP